MFNFRKLFFALSCSAIFTGIVVAQPPPPPPPAAAPMNPSSSDSAQNRQNFISLDGGFTVALPQQLNGFRGIPSTAGINKGGSEFIWETTQGSFLIAYVDRILTPEQKKEVLQISADGLISGMNDKNAKLISKSKISIDGHSGIEIKILSEDKQVGLTRYFLVNDRMFILTSGWREGENGKEQLKALDSFKLIDSKKIIAQRLIEATPAALPQSPIVKKLKTDAEDDGLKGKVKSVTQTEEDLLGVRSFVGIKTAFEEFYDENGNRIKHIGYNPEGIPNSITVYGFINGLKVAKFGENISQGYNPPPPAPAPMSMMPNAEKPKPVDARYSEGYEYKYDDKGRLQEIVYYRNNGEMRDKKVYTYDGSKVDISSYGKEGKIFYKTIEVVDDKGNTIEKTFDRQSSQFSNSVYTYKYDSFDAKGNWSKRTVTGKDGLYGGGFRDQKYIEYRNITYYP